MDDLYKIKREKCRVGREKAVAERFDRSTVVCYNIWHECGLQGWKM